MNYSELLQNFLDSTLNGSDEETLFHALAADDELRFEMKYLLKLRDAVRDDDEARVVPLASTNAIFSQLGYTAPAALVGAAGGIVGSQAGLMTFLKSAGGYLLAMLVGAVITSGIFMLNDDSNNGKLATAAPPPAQGATPAPAVQSLPGTSAQGTPLSSQSAEVSAPSLQGNNGNSLSSRTARNSRGNGTDISGKSFTANSVAQPPSDSRKAAVTESTASIRSTPPTSKPPYNERQAEGPSETTAEASAPAPLSARASKLEEGTPHQDPFADTSILTRSSSGPVTEHRSGNLGSPTPLDIEGDNANVWRQPTFSLGVRAAVLPFELKSATTALPETSQDIDNITANISYPLPFHRNLAFMVEAGKESYLLTFNERRSDGRIFQHEVMPSVFWAGVGARYSFAPMSSFNPFVQLVGGGSEAGMIGRGMFGLQWSLNDQIGMIGGLEYNVAAYRFQGETTTSPKLGANFGITFNLFGN